MSGRGQTWREVRDDEEVEGESRVGAGRWWNGEGWGEAAGRKTMATRSSTGGEGHQDVRSEINEHTTFSSRAAERVAFVLSRQW